MTFSVMPALNKKPSVVNIFKITGALTVGYLRHSRKLPYLLIVPSLIFLGGILYPFAVSVFYSLTNYRLISPTQTFIGFDNYIKLLTSTDFLSTLFLTFLYAAIVLAIQLPLGLGAAHLLLREHPGIKMIRGLSIIPMMIPPIVAGLMWKTIIDDSGVFNYVISLFGIAPVSWLSSAATAFISVVFIDVWVWLPFVTLVLLSGLQTLPQGPYEAAMVDGADAWQRFFYLTLPLLKPFLGIAILFRMIDSLKVFDTIFSTTGGGPANATKVLQIAAYEEAFIRNNMGMAMAQILILWICVYVISMLLVKQFFPSYSLKGKR